MENILITGASGFIGTNMVEMLSKKQVETYAMVLASDKNGIEKLKKISDSINIVTDSVDTMINNIDNYPQFDSIIHFASVGVDPKYNDISTMIDTNIKMGCQLIDFAKRNKTKLVINVGSCFEYGRNNGKPLKESDDCHPESFYALTKNMSVELTNEYAKKEGVNLITVRPFGVFGKWENSYRLAPSIIRSGIENEDLDLTAGEQVRDFVNVKDIVNAIYLLSKSKKIKNYEIYNICSDNPVTVRGFVEEIINILGFDINKFHFGILPYRENEAMQFIGDNTKLKEVINYDFPKNHKDGIMDIYNTLLKERI